MCKWFNIYFTQVSLWEGKTEDTLEPCIRIRLGNY